jgi:hypothetical protein
MGSRVIALVLLGLACIVAAAGGAYMAVRNAQPAAAAVQGNQPVDLAQQQRAYTATGSARATAPGVGTGPTPAADVELTAPSKVPSPEPRNLSSNHTVTPRHPRTGAEALKGPAQEDMASPTPEPPPADAANPQPLNQTPDTVGQAPVSSTAPVVEPPSQPQPEFVDLTVPAESVLGLQVQTPVSSETAHVEDRVDARVTRDVRVGDRVAIPSGSQVVGSVVQVDRGGKVRDRASLAIRFHTLILPDGSRTPLTTDALRREGPSPAAKSAAKIGGATVGGAILGAILGGGKGAAIGGGIGAAGGTAVTMAGDREPATLPAGTIVNVRLMSPVTVTLER